VPDDVLELKVARAKELLLSKIGAGPITSPLKPALPDAGDNIFTESSPGVFPDLYKGTTLGTRAKISPALRARINLLVQNPQEKLATLAQQTGKVVTESPDYGPLIVDPKTGVGSMFDRPGILPIAGENVADESTTLQTLKNGEPVSAGIAKLADAVLPASAKSALDEGAAEVTENLDLIPEAFMNTAGRGAGLGSIMGLSRQALKNYFFPDTTEVSPSEVLTEVAGDTIGGSLSHVGPGGVKTMGRVTGKVANKVATGAKSTVDNIIEKSAVSVLSPEELQAFNKGLLHEAIQGGYTSNEEALKALAKERLGNQAEQLSSRWLNSPKQIAKEFRPPASAYQEFGREPITTNIAWLKENAPKELGSVLDKITLKSKYKAAEKELGVLASDLHAFYSETNLPVTGKKVLQSKSFQELEKTIEEAASDKISASLKAVKDDFLTSIGNKTLTKAEMDAYKAGKLHQLSKYKNRLFPDNETALKELISEKPLTLEDAFHIRQERDDFVDWDSVKDDIAPVQKAQVATSNAMRDALHSTIKEAYEGTPLGNELLRKSEAFHNLMPIVKILDKSQANRAATGWKLSDFMPGVINTPWRMLILSGQLASKNPAMLAGARKVLGAGKPFGREALQEAAKDPNRYLEILKAGKEMLGGMKNIGTAEAGQEIASHFGQDVFNMGQAPQPTKIPRDPELVATNPQLQQAILAQVPPNVGAILQNAWRKSDPLTKEAALGQVIEQLPDLFEPSTTGLMSEVKRGNYFVVTNPVEAEQYAASIVSQYRQGEVDANFMAKQVSALNDVNNRRIYPKPGVMPAVTPTPKTEPPPLEVLASNAKRIGTSLGSRKQTEY